MHIDPTPEQLQAFVAASAGDTGPVVMLNLLKFAPGGGAEDYATYAAAVQPHLARVGGELAWAGACTPALIGPEEAEWDLVALVRYPSRAAFLEMVTDPDYLAIARHRTSALADSRLVPCVAAPLG